MGARLKKVELTGVPETALWNLYQRASAARARYLDDPRAVEVLGRLDYPGAWLLFDAVTAPLQAARRVPGLNSQLPTVPVFQARLGLDVA